jgi:hypothetical protein
MCHFLRKLFYSFEASSCEWTEKSQLERFADFRKSIRCLVGRGPSPREIISLYPRYKVKFLNLRGGKVGYCGRSRNHLLIPSFSRFDPKPPLARGGAASAAVGLNGLARSRVRSSSQTTGDARLADIQFCDFPGRKAGSGRPSAILRADGGLRGSSALPKAANSGKGSSEPGPIRRISIKAMRT